MMEQKSYTEQVTEINKKLDDIQERISILTECIAALVDRIDKLNKDETQNFIPKEENRLENRRTV